MSQSPATGGTRKAPAKVELRAVDDDEAGMRLDRWFQRHFPELSHGALQKLLRTGQVRIEPDGSVLRQDFIAEKSTPRVAASN